MTVAAVATVCMCLSPVITINADDTISERPVLRFGDTGNSAGQSGAANLHSLQQIHPGTPMVLGPITGAFEFDLGGSETRKLQLQLAHSLFLETGQQLLSPSPGSNLLGLDATLRTPLANGLSLHAGAAQTLGNTQFQTLGSIRCMNGTLGPDSYTASGCRFVTADSSPFDRRTLNLGASQEFGRLSASVNWFTTAMESGTAGVHKLNQIEPSAALDNRLLAPLAGEGGLAGPLLPAEYLAGETTGIDLNFQLGLTTDRAGEVRLGLALTRVLDASYEGIYGNNLNPLNWNASKSFDAAELGIEWSRGSFSSGIHGYYREPINFLNRENLDSMSTFDVHFTWRAPWNASLSVGASNILGAGVKEGNGINKTPDRSESQYGRIPYVRYKQDL